MLSKKIFFLIFLSGLSTFAEADATIYGVGARSCGYWAESRQLSIVHGDITSWIEGYVSSYADWSNKSLKKVEYQAFDLYIDNYCQQNSLNSILDASRSLVKALEEK